MALLQTMTVKAPYVGDVEVEGYIKVSQLSGSKDFIDATVLITSTNTNDIISNGSYRFTPSVSDDSENFIKQAYLHLKSLPEFATANDA